MPGLPLIQELIPAPDPVEVFLRMVDLPHCLFLDSARTHPQLEKYSYVMADPFQWLRTAVDAPDPLGQLAAAMAPWRSTEAVNLPPFQGGAAGLLSYDLNRSLERVPPPASDAFGLPSLAMGLYDTVFAFDHQSARGWIVSQGWPATSTAARETRARARLQEFVQRLQQPPLETLPRASTIDRGTATTLAPDDLQPLHVAERAGTLPLYSNFNRTEYCRAVRRTIEHVYAGDAFQVNIAQRLLVPALVDSVTLYLNLRRENAATFAAYFDLDDFQIVSASPERFLQVAGRDVETRPIKGTRPRRRGPEADLFAGDELRYSDKDRSENVMIVDLMRNDLARVCEDDSVQVTQLCEIELYEYVQHLVSAVTGKLQSSLTSIDLLRAAFPGGSITGAPKIRAMEIIADIEPHARGAYCGSLGYLNWNGSLDLIILIRTITAGRGWWQFLVGGGIVAQSDPQREYDETWQKAAGMLRGIEAALDALRAQTKAQSTW